MEILELLEVLEKKILNGKQYFFMHKNEAAVNKQEILDVLESIHRVIDEKYQILKMKIGEEPESTSRKTLRALEPDPRLPDSVEGHEAKGVIQAAKKEALEIKKEIDDYVDSVLENLKLTVTKFKRKLGKLDEVIDMSRERLDRSAHYTPREENEIEP